MADTEQTAIWNVAEKIRNAMLVTRRGENLHARPMAAYIERAENCIYFITDRQGTKDDEIARDPHASVTFSDGNQNHVAFSGNISIERDRELLKRLWSPGAQAYYPQGPEDPNVIALRFQPTEGEVWEGPGTVSQMVKMAVAVATGRSAIDLSAKDSKHANADANS